MDLTGEYTFEAPQALVWQALQDPEVLGSVMPGGEAFETVGENKYAGILNVKVGPVQGKFAGNITLVDVVAPDSYTITVDGRGAPGFVKANGGMKLTAAGETTLMRYEGTAQVGGRIASVGQRLLDASAKSIIRQSLDGLNAYLKMQVAAQTATETPSATAGQPKAAIAPQAPAYVPPSQASVAANVARDIVDDLIPAPCRPVIGGLVAVIAALVLYILLSRSRADA